MNMRFCEKKTIILLFVALLLIGCSTIGTSYRITKKTVGGTIWAVKGAYELTAGTSKLVYSIGKFTFEVARAPIDWPLMNDDIETIDGMPVKEAIRKGRVKNSSYTVKGKRYYPMSVAQARKYRAKGIASWYGHETLQQKGGHMTANGEKFSPYALTAAHKHLPLPTNVKVTNLSNNRSIVVRVNDRGPFPSRHNPDSGKRLIDLSMGAAKKLGFHRKGTTRVRIEVIS
jgi:rare lipoprotein A